MLALIGCRTIQPEQAKPAHDPVEQAIAALETYWIERLDLDYGADCRIRVKTPAMDENGSCRIVITRDNRILLTVHSPMAGTILTVYQDQEQIQLLNYHEKTALLLNSSDRNRYRVLETMNFSGAEFRSIFWGREIASDATGLLFGYKNERPVQIRKTSGRYEQVATIQKWLTYQGVAFPSIISFDDDARKVHLKVVVTRFKPGVSYLINPLPVPDGFTRMR